MPRSSNPNDDWKLTDDEVIEIARQEGGLLRLMASGLHHSRIENPDLAECFDAFRKSFLKAQVLLSNANSKRPDGQQLVLGLITASGTRY